MRSQSCSRMTESSLVTHMWPFAFGFGDSLFLFHGKKCYSHLSISLLVFVSHNSLLICLAHSVSCWDHGSLWPTQWSFGVLVGVILLSNSCFSVGLFLSKGPCRKTQVAFGFCSMRQWARWWYVFVQVAACSKYQGIINADGTEEIFPHNIYVDNKLMVDIWRCIPMTLAAAVEAIFTIMG